MENKYAVVQCSNGSFSIVSEHNSDLIAARNAYWNTCSSLNSAPDVISACVMLTNEKLEVVEGKVEYIYHGEN